ncbi:hypothetical protein OsJ_36687 [Oryza sativa Japonica Group]|uniref:Uncharacterized protein n=1 Tax=Oryza sativa subsp. japonica TaxID=39947 RepID=B9GE04_ORYSJ|nr:hypothetical protein OsJ_36687 [Oryza sativa Japonica Group]
MDRAKAAARKDKAAAAGKETAVSRAVALDDTALLLAAVGSFRKEGSDASRMLDQEMSTRLLHLACKHDAVQCARLLLEGGHGITASPVDARDQLTRTPLQVAAEAHSARCIELLLSKNARTDLKLVDGRPLLALEIALLSRRAQVKWSLDNSIEDLLSSLQEKKCHLVPCVGSECSEALAEKTREVGEVAYRYAMEGRVTVLAMLLLVAEEKISAPVSVVIEGVRTKKSIYYSIVDEALSIGDAPARDSNERRKALLSEIQLLNQFGAALWRDRNIDKRSLPPLLKAAKLPKWAIKDIERCCRGFLWKGQEEVSGGHCLVAWRVVCRPVECGGLGIRDIDRFGKALRLKWEFNRLEQEDRPWTMVRWKSDKDVRDIFNSVAQHIVGDGNRTDFWRGKWLPRGGSIANNWPILFSFVGRTKITVAQGLLNNRWVRDLQGSLSNRALVDYLALWDELQLVSLQSGEADSVLWRFSANGVFSASSAYEFLFSTSIKCPHGELIWKTKAPARVRFFLWLAVKGRCLTADNLSKRGWPHDPTCLLCQSAPEDCNHLLVKCPFTNRVWQQLKAWVNVTFPLPAQLGMELADWWHCARRCFQMRFRTAFDSLFMLVGDVNVTKMLLMGDVDVNEADPEGNTALHWCLSGSSSTQEPRIVWLLLKNGARVFQGNKLGLTPVHSAAAKGNYKALQSLLLHAQDCVDTPSKTKETPLFLAVKNGSLDCVKLLLRSGASTKVQNLSFTGLKTSASHRDFRSSNEYLTEFFTAEFGPMEEAVVIGIRMGDRVQSRGFGFVKFKREEDVISAKETHHVYMLGKRVEVKDAVARGSLPSEIQKTSSFRHHNQEVPKVTHHLLGGELKEEHYIRKRRPLPEKCLPSWFFIFRKWLPGFLADATERLGDRYPLSSLKGDFRAICRMELDHSTLGYPKLSDFMRSLPGICRMCVVPVGSGPATHKVLLPPVSRPKYVPLLVPFSFDHDELPESVSDHQFPMSPLTTNITEDSPRNTDSQHGDTCSESNAESQQDSASTDNGSQLYTSIEPVSTRKLDVVEPLPARTPDRVEPQKIGSDPARKTISLESGLGVQIFIGNGSANLSLQVDVKKDVEYMLMLYQKRTGISSRNIYFVYRGKRLRLNRSLLSYGVQKDSTVNVRSRILGGAGTSLEEYLHKHKNSLVKKTALYDGRFFPELTPRSSILLRTWVLCFTKAFKERHCWEPKCELSHFKVINGHVKVSTPAKGNLTTHFLQENLSFLAKTLKDFFRTIGTNLVSEYPPYFEYFMKFILKIDLPCVPHLQKVIIELNLCFMDSYMRGVLTVRLKQKFDSLPPKQRATLIDKINHITWDTSRMPNLSTIPVFDKIIKKAKDDGEPYFIENSVNFEFKAFNGFRLSRDAPIHAPQHRFIITKSDSMLYYVPSYKNSKMYGRKSGKANELKLHNNHHRSSRSRMKGGKQ